MINREISYERDVNKSYMKIPALSEDNFDETIMLKNRMSGLLPVEKCFVNGMGQYWYNISGKQALDAYCRVNSVGKSFFENLILRFCEQVETLEWNLMDTNCLVVDPELIFVNHNGEEVFFVAYPYNRGNIFLELQQLMEYLLTKLNHSDAEAVSEAYKIYELTLSDGFSISDLKDYILKARMEKTSAKVQKIEMILSEPEILKSAETQDKQQGWEEKLAGFVDSKISFIYEKLSKIFENSPLENMKKYLLQYAQKKEDVPTITYPDEADDELQEITIHPTICIADASVEPRGVLICETHGEYTDFQLGKTSQIIGKNPKVQLQIDRDTISQFHARIDYLDQGYYIEDLNSTNGTYINDGLLSYKQRCRLSSGDKLRFADVSYRFY